MIKAFWSMLVLAGSTLPKAFRTCAQSQQRVPLACNVLALSSQERARHFNELLPALRSLKKSVLELDDGYEFEFPGDRTTLQLLAEWVIQERECCPFFEITLKLEPERGAARLRLTGGKSMAELALGSFGTTNSR